MDPLLKVWVRYRCDDNSYQLHDFKTRRDCLNYGICCIVDNKIFSWLTEFPSNVSYSCLYDVN